MRILLINNLYGARSKGGAERVVEAEAKWLEAAGHEVTVLSIAPDIVEDAAVVTPRDDSPTPAAFPQVVSGTVSRGGACRPGGICNESLTSLSRHLEISPPNIYVYGDEEEHGPLAKFVWHVRDLFNVAGARKVGEVIRAVKPDVVHTHNLMGFGFLVPRMIRRYGLRHVHTVHDVQLVNPSGQIMPGRGIFVRFAEFLHSRILAPVFGSPDAVIFPSEFMERFHDRHGFFRKSRCLILPNPAPPVQGVAGGRPENLSFLFVGQLEPSKGVLLLLDAWREAKIAGATLEFVGDGSARDKVAGAVIDDPTVIYYGRLTGMALAAAYAGASFVVVPSLALENSPTVILEAFAAGVPVVAMRQGGIPELVKDEGTGFLSSVSRPALAAALRRAAAVSEDTWERMSRATQVFAAARRREVIFEKITEILEGK